MSIQTRCPHCNSQFRVPDGAVGKATKCSKCQNPFTVAASLAPSTAATTPVERWTAKAPDGQEYGPVGKAELDGWVSQGRVTKEWQLLKDGAAQWQWAHEVYEELLPAAVSIQTQPPSFGATSTVPTNKHAVTFRPRQYPAMRFVSYFFYGLAVLTAVSLLLSLIGIAMMAGSGLVGAAAAPGEFGGALAGSSAMFGVVAFVMSILYHGMFIALFVYAAESVRIVLDIQQNTQETAHYTKYGLA